MTPVTHRPNRVSRYILSVFCIVLAGLLVLKTNTRPLDPPPSDNVITAEQVDANTLESEAQQAETAALSTYDEIIQRPLFNETRRPIVSPTIQASPIVETSPPSVEKSLTLIAVIMHTDKRIAMLHNDTSKKLSRLFEGESINGWKLTELTPSSVQLVKGTEIRELKLRLSRSNPANIPPQGRKFMPQLKQAEATDQVPNQ